KRAFRYVLNECSCISDKSVHIGDRLNTDIKGAKSVGMKADLFTGAADRSNELNGEYPDPDYIFRNWAEVGGFYLDD
ncbi:MAG: HAD family hydrolase, partial [Balneolaceae bacterium]